MQELSDVNWELERGTEFHRGTEYAKAQNTAEQGSLEDKLSKNKAPSKINGKKVDN